MVEINIKSIDVIRTRGCTAWEFSEEEVACIHVEDVGWETGEVGSEVPESIEPAGEMGLNDSKGVLQINRSKDCAEYEDRKNQAANIPEEYDVDVDVNHCIPLSPGKEAGFDYLASLAAEMSPEQDDGRMAWAKNISPEVPKSGLISTLRKGGTGREEECLENRHLGANDATAMNAKRFGLKDESFGRAENPVTGFVTGRGKEMRVSEMQLQAAKVLLQEGEKSAGDIRLGNEMKLTVSGFRSGSGAALKVPKSKLDAAAKLFDDVEPREHAALLDENIKKSPKSSKKRSLDTDYLSGFSTGSGVKVKISKEKMEAAAQLLAEDGGTDANETPIRQQQTPAAREQTVRKQSFITPTPIRVIQNTPAGDHLGTRSRFAPTSRQSDLLCPAASYRTPGSRQPVSGTSGKENLPSKPVTKYQQRSSELAVMGGQRDYGLSIKQDDTGAQSHKQLCMSHTSVCMMRRQNLPLSPNQTETYTFNSKFGAGDVRAHLLSTGAKSDFVTDEWVRNHYKWVVWKLALMEYFSVPEALGTFLTFSNVQSQIVHRYHKEYNLGQRSFLRGALQRDFPMATPCILKVSEVRKHQVTAELELTDGWYSITAKCDRLLTQHANQDRLFVGMKLRITGAELCGGSPGQPLEATKSTFIILNYNQTHPIGGPATTLGKQRIAAIPIVPISTARPRGGTICKTIVTVLRIFPPLLWSKLPSGVTTFQTSRAAAMSEKIFDVEITNAQAAVEDELRMKELEMCKTWLKIGKQGGMTKVDRLYASMIANEDEELLQSLNESDRAELERYMSSRQQALQDQQKRMIQERLGASMPSAPKAKDIETQTLLIGEVRRSRKSDHLDFDSLAANTAQQKTALITIWRPNENLLKAEEGQILSITSLDTFGPGDALSNGFHGHFLSSLHHFQSTSVSKYDVIEIDKSKFEIIESRPRVTQSVQTLLMSFEQAMSPPNLFDYMGLVIKVGPVYMSSDYKYHFQWIFMVDNSQALSDTELPWLFALQLCGPENAIKWLDKTAEGKLVRCENIEYSGTDNAHYVLRTVGSMATSITNSESLQNCSGCDHGSMQQWIESHSTFITAQTERAKTLMN